MTYRRSETLVFRSCLTRAVNGNCQRCASAAGLLNIDSAVDLSGIDTRHLFGLIENGLVHSVESTSGHLLICRRSLEDLLHGENK